MNNNNYEFVQYNHGYDAKIFMTVIEHSNFHWHYEYEFVFVVKGSVKVNTIPEPVILTEGETILINGETLHEVQKTEENNIILFVQISPALFHLEEEDHTKFYFYLNSKNTEMEPEGGFGSFIAKIVQLGCMAEKEKQDKNRIFRTKALLYDLVASCFEVLIYDIQKQSRDNRSSGMQNKRLLSLISYIEENFRDEYVLENLSEKMALGDKSIHRQLKMGIGLSAKELVTECRIKETKRMLKYTDKSISTISDMVGFNSDKTFYRVFKKQVGITPRDYRKAGEVINANEEIKGYLGINWRESTLLLYKYLKEFETGETF